MTIKKQPVRRIRFGIFAVIFAFITLLQLILPAGINPFYMNAAPGDGWDLFNFITKVSVKDAYGNAVTGGIFNQNQHYIFNLNFSEKAGASGQFEYNGSNRLVYQLPSELTVITAVTEEPVRAANGAEIGRYSITSGGTVTIWFDNVQKDGSPTPGGVNFIDYYTNANFSLEIDAKFTGTMSGQQVQFGTGAEITITVDPPAPYLGVNKSSSYNNQTEVINYTVVITAYNGTVNNISFTDIPYRRSSSSGSKTYPSAASKDAFYNVRYWKNNDSYTDITSSVTWSGSQFSYDFSGVTLNAGDKITITYSMNIQELIKQNPSFGKELTYSFYAGNDINIYSSANNPSDYTQDLVSRTFTGKYYNGPTVNSNGLDRYLTWVAWVGSGAKKLNGEIITDRIGVPSTDYTPNASFNFPVSLSDITVILYGLPATIGTFGNSDRVGNRTFTADKFINVSGTDYISIDYTNKILTFTTPPNNITIDGTPMTDIYRVRLEYRTDIPLEENVTTTSTYKNTIYYDGTNYSSSSSINIYKYEPYIPGPDPVYINKNSELREVSPGVYEINYTITATVPAGRQGDNIYYRDSLYLTGWDYIRVRDNPTNLNISISPMYPGDPALKYTHHFNNTDESEYDIYFGGTDITNASNSVWQYSDEKDIIITYSIPLNQVVPSTGITIGDYLKSNKSYRLHNDAYIKDDTNNMYDWSYTNDAWPVHKEGWVTDELTYEEFQYKVYLNYIQAYPLFSSAPAFVDTFDGANLEYVPGSFYVLDTGTWSAYGGDDNIDVSVAGKITADFANLEKGDWGYSGGWGSAVNWWQYNRRYEVYYKLRIIDGNNVDSNTTFINSVKINATALDSSFSNDASVLYEATPVTKGMSTDGSNHAEVEIIINPYGDLMDTVSGNPTYTARDTMSGDLAFYLNTIRFYTQTDLGSGDWDGVWIAQPTSPTPGTAWSINTTGDPQIIDFILPDETPVRIVYTALINVTAGTSATFGNEIEVFGYSDSDGRNLYQVMNTNAHASADRSVLYLYKEDGDDSAILLGDAEFELYMAIPDGGYYGMGTATKDITIGGMDFHFIEAQTTADVTGLAEFDTEWLTPSHEAVYLLVETAEPEGYLKVDEADAYTFFVLHAMDAGEKNFLETQLGKTVVSVADNIYIKNESLPAVIIEIEKIITGDTPLVERTFTFNAVEITAADDNTPVVDGKTGIGSVIGEGTAEISISGLIGTALGKTYYFEITEDQTGHDVNGWEYSGKALIVTVTMYNDGTYDVDYEDGADNEFENIFTTPERIAVAEFTKAITGSSSPPSRTFTFNAVQVTEQNGTTLVEDGITASSQKTNAGAVNLVFEGLTGTPGGTEYYFKIDEVKNNTGGWTHSTNILWITVTITEDGEDWDFDVAYNDGDTVFTNNYTRPGGGGSTGTGYYKPPTYTTTTPPATAAPPATTVPPSAANPSQPPTTPSVTTANTPPAPIVPGIETEPPAALTSEPFDNRIDNVSIRISKSLTDFFGNETGTGKYFALRIYNEAGDMIDRIDLQANGESVVVSGLESGAIYYLHEEAYEGFEVIGFEIVGLTEYPGGIVGIEVPAFTEGQMELEVILKNTAIDTFILPDFPIPLGIIPFPDFPPPVQIPPWMIPLGNFGFPDDSNPHTGALLSFSAMIITGTAAIISRKKKK